MKVLSVVTGGVLTREQPLQEFALPSESRYKSIEQIVAAGRNGSAHSRMALTTYVNQVIDQIEAKATGKVWLGEHAENAKKASLNPEMAAGWVSCAYLGLHVDRMDANDLIGRVYSEERGAGPGAGIAPGKMMEE